MDKVKNSCMEISTNPEHEELDRFYSTVQLTRGHKLPPLISELTGLTNEELEDAPTYEEVMTELIAKIKKWQVGKICVWGGDKNNFQRDFESRFLDKPLKRSVAKFINTFENIQKEVSLDVFFFAVVTYIKILKAKVCI